jgi:hypothetical protein
VFERFLSEKPGYYFLMADYKKSGWTFPMELITLYFKAAKELYPGYEPFEKLYSIFLHKRIDLYVDNVLENPLRGGVLGMWDIIISFMTSCIFELFKNDIKKSGIHDRIEVMEALFYSDDQVLKVCMKDDPNFVIQIWNSWHMKMESYGLQINREKSFISNTGIFCEEYPQENREKGVFLNKDLNYCLNIFECLRGVNICHKKELWVSYVDDYNYNVLNKRFWKVDRKLGPLFCRAAGTCKELIGDEFPKHFNESNIPYQLGGWRIFRNEIGEPTLSDWIQNHFPKMRSYVRWANLLMLDDPKMTNFEYKKLSFFEKGKYENLFSCLSSEIFSYSGAKTHMLKRLLKDISSSDVDRRVKIRYWKKIYEMRQKSFNCDNIYTLTQISKKLSSKSVTPQ